MAIQAHINPENLGLQNSSQDHFFMSNNNNTNKNMFFSYNNLQQQQYNIVNFQNMQKRNSCVNDNGFMFLQPSSKKQRLETTAATTVTTTGATTASTTTSESDISQSFSVQLEKQRHEIDRFINLQNERLKMALHEQRKQQLRAIVMKLEAKSMELLKKKDDEIALEKNKSIQLQEIMRKLMIENQTWQKITSENEAIVVSLNNTLSQLQQQQQQQVCSSSSSNDINDAESCCELFDKKKNIIVGEEENLGGFDEKMRKGELCKVCNARNVCVLMLPCRHLCCSKVCDGFVDVCPVCKSFKIGSIEAIIS